VGPRASPSGSRRRRRRDARARAAVPTCAARSAGAAASRARGSSLGGVLALFERDALEERRGGYARRQLELLQDVLHVALDGVLGDRERLGDVAVARRLRGRSAAPRASRGVSFSACTATWLALGRAPGCPGRVRCVRTRESTISPRRSAAIERPNALGRRSRSRQPAAPSSIRWIRVLARIVGLDQEHEAVCFRAAPRASVRGRRDRRTRCRRRRPWGCVAAAGAGTRGPRPLR